MSLRFAKDSAYFVMGEPVAAFSVFNIKLSRSNLLMELQGFVHRLNRPSRRSYDRKSVTNGLVTFLLQMTLFYATLVFFGLQVFAMFQQPSAWTLDNVLASALLALPVGAMVAALHRLTASNSRRYR